MPGNSSVEPQPALLQEETCRRALSHMPSPSVCQVTPVEMTESRPLDVYVHKGEDGDLCILDWKRAYEAGKVTLKQIPEVKRWEGFPSA